MFTDNKLDKIGDVPAYEERNEKGEIHDMMLKES